MPREYKVFHGVGVIVVGVQSDFEFEALAITSQRAVDYGVPAMRRIRVNMALTPGHLGSANWSAAVFDDRGVDDAGDELEVLRDVSPLDRAITSIGSGMLDRQIGGAFVGGLFIEHTHYNNIYNQQIGYAHAWPGGYCRLGEISTIAYSDVGSNAPFAGHRYMGFWGTLVSSSPTEFAIDFRLTKKPQPVVFQRGGIDFDPDPPGEALDGEASLANVNTAPKSQGLLFVRLEIAAKLELIDPKVPIGQETIKSQVAASAMPNDPEHVNISLVDPDQALQETQDNVHDEAHVAGAFPENRDRAGVVGVVASIKAPTRPLVIDLIAHARHGVLQFGRWVVDSNERALEQLLQAWQGRPLSKLRLLGCNTALTTAGQAAILHLKDVFKRHGLPDVGVYGATVPLYAYDFGPDGLIKSALLRESARMPRPVDGRPPENVVKGWFKRFQPVLGSTASDLRRLRAETLDEANRRWSGTPEISRWSIEEVAPEGSLDALFAAFEPEFATAPGLLAQPDRELLFPAESRDGVRRFHRVSSLLDGAFLQFYPEGFKHGVIVRAPRP